jgi:orotidine-5'-phosphate decarboxylase
MTKGVKRKAQRVSRPVRRARSARKAGSPRPASAKKNLTEAQEPRHVYFDDSARLPDGRLSRAGLAQLHDVKLRTTHGILLALDMESLDDMKRVVEATTRIEGIVGYKVGLTATLRLGLGGAVRHLRSATDLPLVYDHQKAGPDVPDMAAKFASTCKEAGVDGLILFPIAGPRAVIEFAGHALKHRLMPVVGGDLPFPDYNASGGGYVIDDALDKIFRKALEIGVDHFVIPANTPDKVRRHARWLIRKLEQPTLFVPGIGPLGGTIADTFAAAPGCRVYAVIGRAIYAAADPAQAARSLAAEALRFA